MKYKEYFIGDLVELVNETNKDLKYGLVDIVGVTIDKRMIKTIANLQETSLEKFVLVKKNYFVYNPRTHGKKIGLGMNKTNNTYISTWNNNVFRIKKEANDIVLPDYLYLCFCQEIWDKEACFRSWGSSTVVFSWNTFINMKLSIPSLKSQEKIIKKYQTIEKSILNKKEIISNLEKLAESIFYKLFETKDENNWVEYDIATIASVSAGGDKPDVFSEIKDDKCSIPIYSNGIENDGLFGFTDQAKIDKNSITISARGTVGYIFLRTKPYFPIVRLLSVTPKKENLSAQFLYFYFKQFQLSSNGTSQQQITVPIIKKLRISLPEDNILKIFNKQTTSIFELIDIYNDEIESLNLIKENLIEGNII